MMMAEYNRDALLQSLYLYRDRLDNLIDSIEQEEWTQIQDLLTTNQSARNDFLNSKDTYD